MNNRELLVAGIIPFGTKPAVLVPIPPLPGLLVGFECTLYAELTRFIITGEPAIEHESIFFKFILDLPVRMKDNFFLFGRSQEKTKKGGEE